VPIQNSTKNQLSEVLPERLGVHHDASANCTNADAEEFADMETYRQPRLLDRLHDRGLIERERPADNRRVVNVGITDAGLAHIKGLVNLEYLNLYNTKVGDAGIENLKGMTNLMALYLWQSKVSDEGAATLKNALPETMLNRGEELKLLAKVEEKKAEEKKAEEKSVKTRNEDNNQR